MHDCGAMPFADIGADAFNYPTTNGINERWRGIEGHGGGHVD